VVYFRVEHHVDLPEPLVSYPEPNGPWEELQRKPRARAWSRIKKNLTLQTISKKSMRRFHGRERETDIIHLLLNNTNCLSRAPLPLPHPQHD